MNFIFRKTFFFIFRKKQNRIVTKFNQNSKNERSNHGNYKNEITIRNKGSPELIKMQLLETELNITLSQSSTSLFIKPGFSIYRAESKFQNWCDRGGLPGSN